MEAGFVGQAPDLTKDRNAGIKIHGEHVCTVSNRGLAKVPGAEFNPTLYSWMMPFCWSEGGGSHDTLIDVLLWLPTVNTVTCCGGAPGAEDGRRVWEEKRKQRVHVRI